MKLGLQVRDPFHLDGKLLERPHVLTDEQAKKVRKDREKLRRCTQFAIEETEPIAPQVEKRIQRTSRDKQE